ncbi:hypothetical protein BDY19DRAFT_996705 [Irpex rosettiformis]|uniref:Uncharacterized protein n=1 Tax=Irpex rosettiformis TaxID=378272 RepID=A0ACB8TU64_9APHY|nr:hypothetical protein BDY19DRAFT_996705 [Irpex rosettiformis]
MARVDNAHSVREHSPTVSSPLRESVVAVEPGLLDGGDRTPHVLPPLRFDFSVAHAAKTIHPCPIAIADPSNNYHPRIIDHPPHTNDDDDEYEVDQLMEDLDSDSDLEDLLTSEGGSLPPMDYDHDLYLDEPAGNSPKQRKIKIEARGHMVLRNGKVTGLSQNIAPPPFSPTLPAQPQLIDEDTSPLDLTSVSPSVTTIFQATASSVPSLSTVTTGPHIPAPLSRTALSYHTAVMSDGEGLSGAAVDTPTSTPPTSNPQLSTPPPDQFPLFSVNLPQAGSTTNDELCSLSPSSTAATHGSSPPLSLDQQIEEIYIQTRPVTPDSVVTRKEKFREELEAARAHNPIMEESEDDESTTAGSPPPPDDDDMDEGDPDDYTLPTRLPYRRIIQHQFHLPSVSTQVEALVVNDEQFVPPHAVCNTDPNLPTEFFSPVLHPLITHLQLRRQFCLVLEHAALIALDRGINTYLEHIHASISHHNLFHYHDCYHLRSEWIGNPFLFAIERMRLAQFLHYFDESDPDHEDAILKSLCEMIDEVLRYRPNSTDWEMIARQRLAGYYGPPYTMPSHL